jgi:aspartyl-tRNA(Asn)/glutamyl-tRNA(Gln) amidotransferase subunit A
MKASFNAAIEGVGALLTPTAVTPALPVASIDQNTTAAKFMRWVNFFDLCAATVPNGFIVASLPTSLQIVRRAYAVPLALRIGYAYQAAHDWHQRFLPWRHSQGRAGPLSDGSTTTRDPRFRAKDWTGHDDGRVS